VYYEVWQIPGLSIVGKKVSTQDMANATKSQTFYNWMSDQEGTTAVFMLENLTKSTTTQIVYDNVVDGIVKTSSFDGYNVSKPKGLRPGDTDVEINGRLYDKTRFIKVPNAPDDYFLVGVAWVHEEELRVFGAYPEMLVVDAKANTNKYKKAFFRRRCGRCLQKFSFIQDVDPKSNTRCLHMVVVDGASNAGPTKHSQPHRNNNV
jgi:hypothetical protein